MLPTENGGGTSMATHSPGGRGRVVYASVACQSRDAHSPAHLLRAHVRSPCVRLRAWAWWCARSRVAGKKQVAWMDVCEDLGEIDSSFMPADQAPPLALTKVAMSAQAMMLDAADGVIDGKVGDGSAMGGFVDRTSKGAFQADHDGW